jgi:hypothetical protein
VLDVNRLGRDLNRKFKPFLAKNPGILTVFTVIQTKIKAGPG